MKNSKEYYNSIARTYAVQTNNRMLYLNAIDNLVIDKMKSKSNLNYLDIGSGDGRRALKIANSLKTSELTLLDDSDGMLDLLSDKNVKCYNVSFTEFNTEEKFDLITCLWNVLGHFQTKDKRLEFFRKIEKMLSRDGILFFDVNNRYNISYYGFENVMNNLSKDKNKHEGNGIFHLSKENTTTKVYIHNPFDIDEYLDGTSLKLLDTLFVNYETGKLESTFFEGQLLYLIGKK